MSWKVTAFAPRLVVEGALVAHEDAWDWDHEIVLSGREIAEDQPEEWQLEAWLDHKPTRADKAAIAALFAQDAPKLIVEELPDTDWLVASQEGLEPIRAGRFHVHTPDHPATQEPGVFDFVIPASQAFGTGQHATTAGCLAMLTHMKAQGLVIRNCADIGTGTGLLAFAAQHLWPDAHVVATDIDPAAVDVTRENAALNAVAGLELIVADGALSDAITTHAPYDLLIANILAGPLVSMAPEVAAIAGPQATIVLAGLLDTQRESVVAAFAECGCTLDEVDRRGDWTILRLTAGAERYVPLTPPDPKGRDGWALDI